MFILDTQLQTDTIDIGDLPLCKVLLMNNAFLPWLILVPRREGIQELFQLNASDQVQAQRESVLVSKLMMTLFEGDKLNIGAIGNLVPQLHLHHVVRYKDDPCWPKPVWGNLPERAYAAEESKLICQTLRDALNDPINGFQPH